MQLGMVGLGRMGANMVERLREGAHDLAAFDRNAQAVAAAAATGAKGLFPPLPIWFVPLPRRATYGSCCLPGIQRTARSMS